MKETENSTLLFLAKPIIENHYTQKQQQKLHNLHQLEAQLQKFKTRTLALKYARREQSAESMTKI